MSLLVLGCSVAMDILQKSNTATMFALPFVVTLITGKQYIDYKKKQEWVPQRTDLSDGLELLPQR